MPLCFKATIHRIVQLTITLGVSSGGLEVAANLRDLLRRSCHFTHGFTDEKALYAINVAGRD